MHMNLLTLYSKLHNSSNFRKTCPRNAYAVHSETGVYRDIHIKSNENFIFFTPEKKKKKISVYYMGMFS